MTVAEIDMQNYKLDDHFESICALFAQEVPSHEEKGMNWWLSKYPTLESAEVETLNRHKELKSLKRSDCANLQDYVSRCSRLDYDIMMLEMTTDELRNDWSPTGAKHEDFRIGTVFRSGSGRYLCTDVGTRTVVAIRYTPTKPENMDGPPYFLVETVFDEDDIKGVDILQ